MESRNVFRHDTDANAGRREGLLDLVAGQRQEVALAEASGTMEEDGQGPLSSRKGPQGPDERGEFGFPTHVTGF